MIEALQSALDPHGHDARVIAGLWWMLFAGAVVIHVLVASLAAWAAFGRATRPRWLSAHGLVIGGGIVLPLLVLFPLLVHSWSAAARLNAAHAAPALRIEVVGEQWWWRVRYLDEGRADAADFDTANEIRIPVGESVELKLRSADVLHSLWVPSLAGKLDMIPGRENRLVLRAERAGVYRGQCAEYCGGPHAQMALHVIALERGAFERWRDAQRAPAAQAPAALFLERCAVCHTVRGTPAAGTLGPDLTHVGSRVALAAGILPNDIGAAAAWIGDGQHLKPGNLMPAFGRELSGAQLGALAAYVSSLR